MSDEDLAKFLEIHDDPRWPRAIANLDPAKRAQYEHMADVIRQLDDGTIPSGVIVCREHKHKGLI